MHNIICCYTLTHPDSVQGTINNRELLLVINSYSYCGTCINAHRKFHFRDVQIDFLLSDGYRYLLKSEEIILNTAGSNI